MENKLSNEYIENAVNELEKFFGVKEPVLRQNIFALIRGSQIKKATKLIARQLGLPIDINIINVPNNYQAQNTNGNSNQSYDNQFHSTQLTKAYQDGSAHEGITAQVTIPGNLPFYGSSALNNYPINVKISDNCTAYPAAFTLIMAHELSHILLHSLSYSQKENEFYTDLTAMILGFCDIFQSGRKIEETSIKQDFIITTTQTQTTTYGYLNDEQFDFAYNKINSILKENRARKKLLSNNLKKFIKLFSKYEKILHKFKNFLRYLAKNTNKKISGEDGKRIVLFFQPNYVEELDLSLAAYKKKRIITQKFLNGLSHYTEQRMNQLTIFIGDLETYSSRLKIKLVPLIQDVKILEKYVGYKYKIRNFWRFLLKRNKK